jgi:hypothetical protein
MVGATRIWFAGGLAAFLFLVICVGVYWLRHPNLVAQKAEAPGQLRPPISAAPPQAGPAEPHLVVGLSAGR